MKSQTYLQILSFTKMLQSIALVLLTILYCLREELPLAWETIVFEAAASLIWWRCCCLRRGSLVVGCALAAWECYDTSRYGMWIATALSGLTAIVFATRLAFEWAQLQPGL